MSPVPPAELQALADEALSVGDVASAVIFLAEEAGSLRLAAAAGIAGPALDGLVAAVQSPTHPVHRALTDPDATFDVRPVNPGGPALRSHLPLRSSGHRAAIAVGVLAVAHDRATTERERRRLVDLAARALTEG
jgi:hypothetical protein